MTASKAGRRADSAANSKATAWLERGVAGIAMAATAQTLLHGAQATQSGQQGALAGTVMHHPGGRLIIGVVGLAVVAAWTADPAKD